MSLGKRTSSQRRNATVIPDEFRRYVSQRVDDYTPIVRPHRIPTSPVQSVPESKSPSSTRKNEQFAKLLAKLLAEETSYSPSDVNDEHGNRRPIDQLLSMAKYSTIWPMLSEVEKMSVTDTPGVLANDRSYIARKVTSSAPLTKPMPFVINASGERVQLI